MHILDTDDECLTMYIISNPPAFTLDTIIRGLDYTSKKNIVYMRE